MFWTSDLKIVTKIIQNTFTIDDVISPHYFEHKTVITNTDITILILKEMLCSFTYFCNTNDNLVKQHEPAKYRLSTMSSEYQKLHKIMYVYKN